MSDLEQKVTKDKGPREFWIFIDDMFGSAVWTNNPRAPGYIHVREVVDTSPDLPPQVLQSVIDEVKTSGSGEADLSSLFDQITRLREENEMLKEKAWKYDELCK